jgi:hypothetical protein
MKFARQVYSKPVFHRRQGLTASIRRGIFVLGLLILGVSLPAQQYNSVPLENEVYDLIDQAVIRGLCAPPPSAKPWPEFTLRRMLAEIASAPEEALGAEERRIVAGLLERFSRKSGWDWRRGAYHGEHPIGSLSRYSFDAGLYWQSDFSVNLESSFPFATANRGTVFVAGDVGNHVSYGFNVRGGFFIVRREKRPPYTDTSTDPPREDEETWDVNSYPPYSFTRLWDSSVFYPSNLRGYNEFPDGFAFGYEIISEISAAFVEDHIRLRMGRMRRDWGPSGSGASLILNAQARPFTALEGSVIASEWLRFSFLTGGLEYLNVGSLKGDAFQFQNFFSLGMAEINVKQYLYFDFGSTTVWPKRMEIGYLFPANSNFFYQNNVGDFDNLGLFADLTLQYPGIGRLWVSLFVDEMDLSSDPFFNLNRNMYAYQAGLRGLIPLLPFTAVELRYTKVEPYCYTYPAIEVPWNKKLAKENYINNGEALGYYLPPNSDELLVRVESLPLPGLKAYLQYQMIRHGADYGPGRVFGSSLSDELSYDWEGAAAVKYFLHDGVYRWDHVIKLGGSYRLLDFGFPLTLSAEAGIDIRSFTGIEGEPGKNTPYRPVNTEYYRPGTGIFFSLGVKIFGD